MKEKIYVLDFIKTTNFHLLQDSIQAMKGKSEKGRTDWQHMYLTNDSHLKHRN
jgi:hypothetical protein